MKVLLVDDDAAKRDRVATHLQSSLLDRNLEVVQATNYEDTLRELGSTYYDLVILDLVLPAAGSEPSPETSRAIIREVTKGSASIPPMHIIGLTAYEEVASKERDYYDSNLFALVLYSETSNDWRRVLTSKIHYLVKSKEAAAAFQSNSFDFDIVVIAARYENEYQPVKERLFRSVEAESHPRWRGRIAIGPIEVTGLRTLRGALCCVDEMGMAPAAAVASQAISTFRPRLLGMLGMCCGFATNACASPRKLLDAIIVREVNCWEEGKYDAKAVGSGFRNRGRDRMIDQEILADVEGVVEAAVDTFMPQLKKLSKTSAYRKVVQHFAADLVRQTPDVQLSSLVSGSSVVADRVIIDEILGRNPKALGLDMEMYGVYSAAAKAMGRQPSVLGVKGVADFGEVDKDDAAQKVASVVSAEVFKGLLGHLRIW